MSTTADQTFTRASFPRLVTIELRKLVDTRAGLWVMGLTIILSLAATVATLALPHERLTGSMMLATGGAAASLLLPVMAILTLTTEWATGSAVTLFLLEPRRGRVVLAKFAALILVSLAVTALLVAAAACTAAALRSSSGAPAGRWDVGWADVGQYWLGILLSVLMGAAFGCMFMSTAVAIVTYLVLPMAWSILATVAEKAQRAAAWLDTSSTYSLLLEGRVDTSREWQQVGVSTLVWVLLPLAIGTVRLFRREVK